MLSSPILLNLVTTVAILALGLQIRLRGDLERPLLRVKAARQVLWSRSARGDHIPVQQHENRVQVGQHCIQKGLQGTFFLRYQYAQATCVYYRFSRGIDLNHMLPVLHSFL